MKIRRKQRQTKVKPFRLAVFIAFFTTLFLSVAATAGIYFSIGEWVKDLPSVTDTSAFTYSEKSVMYAADRTTVLAEFQLENSQPLKELSQVSEYVRRGTVATEDSRFYEHEGVDIIGLGRAAVRVLSGGSREGGSTITMQLVRNTVLADEMQDITLKRKVREIALALEMEKTYSKDDILLMYLNTINYGDGCYGIEAAAQHYFSKSASDLTLVEAATLVGIPQSPTYLNPVNNPENCKTRRDTVLGRMLSNGDITQQQYDEAVAQPLTLNLSDDEIVNNGIYLYPYFTTYVRDLLVEQYGSTELFTGGWKIYTTLDISKQKAAEEACQEAEATMNSELEAALVAMDPDTGYIVAMVGGESFEENQFNIATQKGRPTGSSFKVFTLVTALEQGISPETMVDCSSKIILSSGESVENFGGADYGVRSIQSATAVSSNTGYIRIQQEVGTISIIETAQRMGIKEATLPVVNTLTLGVCDITPLEMATAYTTLASGGIYHEHQAISEICNSSGEVIFKANTEGQRVVQEDIAGAATKVLKTVFTSGTASKAQLANGRTVAGKTGTSSDYKDHTLVGYTPSLVCATWIGDRYNRISDSATDCCYLFKDFMDGALEGTANEEFKETPTPNYTTTYLESLSGDESTTNSSSSSSSSSSNRRNTSDEEE